MSEIKINIDNLEQEIICLRSLASNVSSNTTERPQVVGGGESIQALENLGLTFEQMKEQVVILVTETIAFMNGIKTTIEKQDEDIAKDIMQCE